MKAVGAPSICLIVFSIWNSNENELRKNSSKSQWGYNQFIHTIDCARPLAFMDLTQWSNRPASTIYRIYRLICINNGYPWKWNKRNAMVNCLHRVQRIHTSKLWLLSHVLILCVYFWAKLESADLHSNPWNDYCSTPLELYSREGWNFDSWLHVSDRSSPGHSSEIFEPISLRPDWNCARCFAWRLWLLCGHLTPFRHPKRPWDCLSEFNKESSSHRWMLLNAIIHD